MSGPPCKFCGSPALACACVWPIGHFVPIDIDELEVGDTIRRFTERCLVPNSEASPKVARIVAIEPLQLRATPMRKITLSISRPAGAPYSRTFTARSYAAVLVRRDGPCAAPVCEAHAIERGPFKVVCYDHWHAWERVA